VTLLADEVCSGFVRSAYFGVGWNGCEGSLYNSRISFLIGVYFSWQK